MAILSPLAQPVSYTSARGRFVWGDGKQWVLFAGPDLFEDEGLVMESARELKKICADAKVPWILKCSFDKANRSSGKSFRGLGVEHGLKGLEKIKGLVGCDVITDVHDVTQMERVAEVADVIQIPAFLCRQTDLLQAAAKTGRVLHVKKGQFMAPWDMKSVVEKIVEAGGAHKTLLCERGTTFGYNRLVNDMTGLPEMRKLGVPVIMDATHSTQRPSGLGDKSGGDRDMIPVLARAAMAVGIDGLFMECHPNPDKALCDGPSSLPLAQLPALLKDLQNIWSALQLR